MISRRQVPVNVPSDTEAALFADQHGVYYDRDPAIAGAHARAILAKHAAATVVMGRGNIAVGTCKRAEDGIPGIIYLAIPEVREHGTDCADVYPVGSPAPREMVLACIQFETPQVLQQSIDVLKELQQLHCPVAESAPPSLLELMPEVIATLRAEGMSVNLVNKLELAMAEPAPQAGEGQEPVAPTWAMIRDHLGSEVADTLCVTRWKDGIDIQEPVAGLVKLIAACHPAPQAAQGGRTWNGMRVAEQYSVESVLLSQVSPQAAQGESVCKGSMTLGTGCGECARCRVEIAQPAQDERKPIDANELEAMAKQRPDDKFLKGSGVLKLIAAIRLLEGQLRDIQAKREQLVQDEKEAFEASMLKRGYTANDLDRDRFAGYECRYITKLWEGWRARAALSTPPMEGDALDTDELEELRDTAEHFADEGETTTPYDRLLRWANMGLLDCTHFEVSTKGEAAIAAMGNGDEQ